MRSRTRSPITVLLVLSLVMGACGGDDEPTVRTGGASGDGWVRTDLTIDPGPDDPAILIPDGEDLHVIVGQFGEGEGGPNRLAAQRIRDGEAVDVPATVPSGARLVQIHDGAAGANGPVAVGAMWGEESHGAPVIWHLATDGGWLPADLGADDGAGEVIGVTAGDWGYLAVGVHSDPAAFEGGAAAWRSEDGETWDAIDLPPLAADSILRGVAATASHAVAVGRAGGRAVAVQIPLDGTAPTARPLDGTLNRITALGDRLVALGGEIDDEGATSTSIGATSDDSGTTWRPIPRDGSGFDDTGAPIYGHVRTFGDRVLATGVIERLDPMQEPPDCWVDLEACTRAGGSRDGLWTSMDGLRWQSLQQPDMGTYSSLADAATLDGDLVVLGMGEGYDLALWTWVGGGDPDTVPTVTTTTGPADLPPLLTWEDEPEVGKLYRFQLDLHCGLTWLGLGFDDRRWKISGPEPPRPHDVEMSYGYLQRVTEDRIEYLGNDRQPLATYVATDEEPPGCA